MRKLSLTIGIICIMFNLYAQSPHGESLALDCSDCHTTGNWEYAATSKFLHSATNFALEGQHQFVDCRSCHASMVFSETKSNCIDCHTDMHNNTLGLDCARCHTPSSWIIENVTELHLQSRFPLLGAHKIANCIDCHLSSSNLDFSPLGTECVDCHRQDYEQTTNPNHVRANVSFDCIECHKVDQMGWSASGFNHDFFPLDKGHAVSDCKECHTTGILESVSSDCYSCHQPDFEASINPSHVSLGFTNTCEECHTIDEDWKPASYSDHDVQFFPIYTGEHNNEWEDCSECHTQQSNFSSFSCTDCHEHNQSEMNEEHQGLASYSYNSIACMACHPNGSADEIFDHNTTAFPLRGKHEVTSCVDCHTQGFSNMQSECVDCHTENYNQAQDPKHLEAGISLLCEDCHDENAWQPSSFDHSITSDFELSNGHADRQCSACHIGTTTEAVNDCFACHEMNYNEAKEHVSLDFSHDCLECHNTSDWQIFTFDHNTTTFALTGSHITVDCESCHTEAYGGTSTLCNACHYENYNSSVDPSHTDAGISVNCEECHTTVEWVPSSFNHQLTGFELTNGHANRQCSECHIGTTTEAVSNCYSCHSLNYEEATDHVVLSFPLECEACHNTVDWADATFDHNATEFPLTGSHIAVDCNQCHTDGFAETSALCQSCHTDNYNQANIPNHTLAGVSLDCEDCHQTIDWKPSIFNHNNSTGFDLSNGHNLVQCSDCHTGTTTSATSDCYSCHSQNYAEAAEHLSLNFPHDCLTCHNTIDWNAADFDHNATNFPLTGSHTGANCIDCHSNGYAGTSTSCQSCHIENYNTASNPSHTNAGISTDCDECHGTYNWTPSTFNHINTTGFALTGGHNLSQCADCHIGTTTNADSDCYSCHSENYNSASNHLASSFPHDCTACHNTSDWEDATFDHNATGFILTGAHISRDCIDCHSAGYSGTDSDCAACHQSDYNQTSNPNHSSIGLSNNCDDCHTTNPDWEPATFDVHDDFYRLNGAHRDISSNCYLCHSGNYNSTSNTCYACHTSDYNNTNDPSHTAANFPTDCAACHSENAWEPATFDHDGQYFPIYSGEHRGEWNNCSDCHTTANVYSAFSCIDCHEHNKNDMDDEHSGESGYEWVSASCLSCHPDGRED